MIAEKAAAKGIDVLDAPICRGRWSADDGTLLALVGGTDAVVERSRRCFRPFVRTSPISARSATASSARR